MSLTCNGEPPQISKVPKSRLPEVAIPIQNIEYFKSCARIRNISPRALMIRIMEAIGRDQLVGSVLDDEGEMLIRRRGEWRYRE